MLIERFVVADAASFGLQPIEMNRLGRFVALTGKNGAGKSRLLNLLEHHIQQHQQKLLSLDRVKLEIKNLEEAIDNYPPDNHNQSRWRQDLEGHRNAEKVQRAAINIVSPNSNLVGLRFVPKSVPLQDARNYGKSGLLSLFSHAQRKGFVAFEQSCFAYIQMLQNNEWDTSHPRASSDYSPATIQEAREKYESLVLIIEALLKTRLERVGGDAYLFGKPLAEANLSDGQKVLIQVAVALHAQGSTLANTVFLMDEPENHLHPSALIEFLDRLSEVAGNSQFWIATHSVPLLAHLAAKEPMSIWYVEEGKVSNAGSKPELVLRGLLGNEEQLANLNAFTALPAQYAAITFAAQCLIPPNTVAGGTNDPQVAQVNSLLSLDAVTPVSLLDFGAGKSRLLSGLAEIADSQGRNIADSLSYFAFDLSPADREDSIAVIKQTYGAGTSRHFATADEFFSNKDQSSMDVVVMCNVLHEIPQNEWLELFSDSSVIGWSLKDTGHLLLVEDQRIPTGEKAHKFGFLVLDTPHLRTLFSVTEEDMRSGLFQAHDQRGDGRLKAHRIAKPVLARLNAETRVRAIQQLRQTAKDRIGTLRQEVASDFRTGHLHGFWTQQFANASLWLAEQGA